MKKCFISIPITGMEANARNTCLIVKECLSALFSDCEFVSPFEIAPEKNQPDSYYMGRDVEALLGCDSMVSLPGWQMSKGCNVERYIADVYQIKMYTLEDLLDTVNDKISYVIGDATNPHVRDGNVGMIAHCCNTLGIWGGGFVIPLANRYPSAKRGCIEYLLSHKGRHVLGDVNYVSVAENLTVANIFGQERLDFSNGGLIPLDYFALLKGFKNVSKVIAESGLHTEVHMPRIGCGLAGGQWDVVVAIMLAAFKGQGNVEIIVHDLG